MMSEQSAVAILDGNGHGEEFADLEQFVDETGAYSGVGLPENLRNWFPTEYVELALGHRGSGKSTRVARKLLLALKHGYPVFTNYELYPEKIGITNQPKPLDLQFLLSFDPGLTGAVIGIGEVDTWVERKRAMSTSSIMVDKFLHQLRKRGLRVIMDTQSPSLPTVILNQVDLMVEGHDSFYTDWGREAGLYKGTTFYYDEEDYSGLFTGYRGRRWQTALSNAYKIWPLYNTYQVFDPWQWARKVEIVGEKMVYDMDEGKAYTSGERNLAMEQKEVEQFNTLLKAEYRAWGNDFIKMAQAHNAVLNDGPNQWRLSLDKVQKMIVRLKGKQRKRAEQLVERLQTLAQNSNGYLARIDRGEDVIEMSKPLSEATETQDFYARDDYVSTASPEETIRDLYATGYKPRQIAAKLKMSEAAITTVIQEAANAGFVE